MGARALGWQGEEGGSHFSCHTHGPNFTKSFARIPAKKEVFHSKSQSDLGFYLYLEESYTMIPDKMYSATVHGEQFNVTFNFITYDDILCC